MQIIETKPHIIIIYNGVKFIKMEHQWCRVYERSYPIIYDISPLTNWYYEEIETAYNKFCLRQLKLERIVNELH